MATSRHKNGFPWMHFVASTKLESVFTFSAHSDKCCRYDHLIIGMAIERAVEVIKQRSDLRGELKSGSVRRISKAEKIAIDKRIANKTESDLAEAIRRDSELIRADGKRVFGEESPWYNQ